MKTIPADYRRILGGTSESANMTRQESSHPPTPQCMKAGWAPRMPPIPTPHKISLNWGGGEDLVAPESMGQPTSGSRVCLAPSEWRQVPRWDLGEITENGTLDVRAESDKLRNT